MLLDKSDVSRNAYEVDELKGLYESMIQILPTCLSNRGPKARLESELTPWIQSNKRVVPEPSGSSSIRFNFDSMSVVKLSILNIP